MVVSFISSLFSKSLVQGFWHSGAEQRVGKESIYGATCSTVSSGAEHHTVCLSSFLVVRKNSTLRGFLFRVSCTGTWSQSISKEKNIIKYMTTTWTGTKLLFFSHVVDMILIKWE